MKACPRLVGRPSPAADLPVLGNERAKRLPQRECVWAWRLNLCVMHSKVSLWSFYCKLPPLRPRLASVRNRVVNVDSTSADVRSRLPQDPTSCTETPPAMFDRRNHRAGAGVSALDRFWSVGTWPFGYLASVKGASPACFELITTT